MGKSILVTGGTGTLGRVVVERLGAAGLEPRVMSRRPRPDGDTTPGEWVVADLKTGSGLDEAVTGADVILHCANDSRSSGDDPLAVTGKLVDAARRAGSPHLVYISIVGIDKIPVGYYRAKLADERLIRDSGLPYTILRATQFHDLVRVIFAGAAKLPLMFVPAVSFQTVDVHDVADRLIELATAEPTGTTLDMGGPRVRTARDMARGYLRSTGRHRLVVPVRLPGKIFRALKRGAGTTPENATGTITFEQYLADHPAASAVSYRSGK